MLCSVFPRFALLTWLHFTGRMREMRLQPGERVEPDADYAYLVTRGTAELLRAGPGGHDILLRVVRPGEVVRESGMLQAETRLELLAMPRSALQ